MSKHEFNNSDVALAAIQNSVDRITGKTTPISRDMRIDCFFDAFGLLDDFDVMYLSEGLEETLGVKISEQDWNFLSGRSLVKSTEEWEEKFAPLFTFGRLADLIASRLPPTDTRGITVLGSHSKAAGAFRRIQQLAKQVNPAIANFGPSTPIADRFRGRRLQRFWVLVRRLSESRIPPLNDTKYKIAETMNGSKGVLSVLLAGLCISILFAEFVGARARMNLIEYIVVTGLFGILSAGPIAAVALAAVQFFRAQRITSLPNGISTFRDLAELISGDRGGWCEKCGYDLTGLTSDRCPECGMPTQAVPLRAPPSTK